MRGGGEGYRGAVLTIITDNPRGGRLGFEHDRHSQQREMGDEWGRGDGLVCPVVGCTKRKNIRAWPRRFRKADDPVFADAVEARIPVSLAPPSPSPPPHAPPNSPCCHVDLKMQEALTTLIAVLPLQFVAYDLSLAKRINPDISQNFAKAVTTD